MNTPMTHYIYSLVSPVEFFFILLFKIGSEVEGDMSPCFIPALLPSFVPVFISSRFFFFFYFPLLFVLYTLIEHLCVPGSEIPEIQHLSDTKSLCSMLLRNPGPQSRSKKDPKCQIQKHLKQTFKDGQHFKRQILSLLGGMQDIL